MLLFKEYGVTPNERDVDSETSVHLLLPHKNTLYAGDVSFRLTQYLGYLHLLQVNNLPLTCFCSSQENESHDTERDRITFASSNPEVVIGKRLKALESQVKALREGRRTAARKDDPIWCRFTFFPLRGPKEER
ncbi:Uncharacterized protein Rs2_48882 [Raphanus sativus]|uniref:Uncharacterized protein LOC130504278 n=1 Tax=Raphanus sativus TaxID=3726 RepID=A0A9W3CTH4_RAPSA|nr:uncharacterized protein LOC130504278 [Raphanus sativus]KAJ4869553.1 Uncharacterized protein Rs2_48882 [Raphanus sativus]